MKAVGAFPISVYGAIIVVGLIGAAIPMVAFHVAPLDGSSIAAVGSLA